MIDWMKENIFVTEGRLNRLKYFKYTLLVSLIFGVLDVVLVWLTSKIIGSTDSFLLLIMHFMTMLPMMFGNMMVSVRRCHDLNLSGGFVLLTIVPLVCVLFWIYLLLAKGTVGWNKYGADPLMLE